MSFQFDLTREPWIPVRDLAGRRRLVGLRELLVDAHTFRRLDADTPEQLLALKRFLMALLQRVVAGPVSTEQHLELYTAGHFDPQRVQAYLDRWQDRFDLFHPEQPFFQVHDYHREAYPEASLKSVAQMVPHLASSNNARLFDHSRDDDPRAMTPAEAALALLTHQATVMNSPKAKPFKVPPNKFARALVVTAERHNLFQTLALTLARYSREEQDRDQPVWEQAPLSVHDIKARPERAPYGLTDQLTWRLVSAHLLPEEDEGGRVVVRCLYWGGGLDAKLPHKAKTFLDDPMLAYRLHPKDGWLPIKLSPTRALWQDFHALLPAPQSEHYSMPATLQTASLICELAGEDEPLTITVEGLALDKSKYLMARHERFSLPTLLLRQPDSRYALDAAINFAQRVWGSSLRRALQVFLRQYDSSVLLPLPKRGEDDGKTGKGQPRPEDTVGAQHYWSELDVAFHAFLDRLQRAGGETMVTAALTAWRRDVQQAARDAYDLTVTSAPLTDRADTAAAMADIVFFGSMKRFKEAA